MAIDGTWNISLKTPMGDQEVSVTYKTNGSTLTGTSMAMGATVNIENGTVDGDSYEHTLTIESPMGDMKTTVSGKVDGDTISGEFKMGQFKIPFTGKRA